MNDVKCRSAPPTSIMCGPLATGNEKSRLLFATLGTGEISWSAAGCLCWWLTPYNVSVAK